MAYWLLAAHILDLYWIIVPTYAETSFQLSDLGFDFCCRFCDVLFQQWCERG